MSEIVTKKPALLRFVNDKPRLEGETFTLKAYPRALFRVLRFDRIEPQDVTMHLWLAGARAAGCAQRPEGKMVPLFVMFGIGAEVSWDVSHSRHAVSLTLVASKEVGPFEIVVHGEAVADAADPQSITGEELDALTQHGERADVTWRPS